MDHKLLHEKIVEKCDTAVDWFAGKAKGLAFPIYSSFDIRDAGFKLGPVDANIFPAGFNNICKVDQDSAVGVTKEFLDSHYSPSTKKIVLITEEHTQNPYYWDNVWVLKNLLESAGRQVRLAMPKTLEKPLELTSAQGHKMNVYGAVRDGAGVQADGFKPDLLISNNDFSVDYEEWARGLSTPMNPPRELGWYRRRKDRFFRVYNQLAGEFAKLIGVDPWTIQVETELFSNFVVDDEASRDQLAAKAEEIYQRVVQKYKEHKIQRDPFLFVKNNAGTYGLGVVQVKSPAEIRGWNYKSRKKMKAAKGGREVSEVIIQEGIPTTVLAEGGKTAEPVIYMIGCQLAGGFLRAHGDKDDQDSLNSPGAVYQRLCVSDLEVKMSGCPMENAYGWLAKLSFLSVAIEAKELEAQFQNYNFSGPCS